MGGFGKKLFLVLFSLCLIFPLTFGEIFSVDPCGTTQLIDNGDGTLTYGNDCMDFTVADSGLTQNFEVNNYLDSNSFQMLIQGITEESPSDDNEIEFVDLTWNVITENGFIEWESTDGVFRFGYIINGNTFKSVATVTGYIFVFPDSHLMLKNLVKKSKETDIISFIEPIVDGTPISVDTSIKTAGQNTFYWQNVGRGSLIEIDPVYVVDYSPNPATHLIDGDVDLDSESAFGNLVGITTGMSDNLTSTNYGTDRRSESYPSFVWYKEQDVVDTTKIASIGGTVSDVHHEYVGSDWGRILVLGGETFKNGDDVRIYMRPNKLADENQTVYLKDSSNTYTLGTFNTGTDQINYNWRIVTLNNVPNGTTDIRLHDNSLVTGGFDVQYDYVEVIIYNETGTAISGRWAEQWDDTYNWFLGINKVTAGEHNVWVYGYQNSNDLAVSYKTNKTLIGTGWFYIPVDSIMEYENNTVGLSFTQLRFFSFDSGNYSEVVLKSQANDTILPTIDNCTFNVSGFSCNQTALASCDIVDDTALTQVLFEIDGVNLTATKQNNMYYYVVNDTGFDNITHNWSYVFATDLINNTNSSFINLTTQYLCEENITCIESWVSNPVNCQINDSYLLTYNDTNVCNTTFNLPVNNGTFQFCNYCTEELVQLLGNCTIGNNQTVDYYDNNKTSCCDVTGLGSDCTITYYPYNETTSQFCHFYDVGLGELNCPSQFDFTVREKEYCIAHIPSNFSNESFKCISFVKDLNSSVIIQTNPEYRERASTFFDLKQDPETREYFAPANLLVNFYYTKKNLDPEHDYVANIECCSEQRCLVSAQPFQVGYENLDFVFFRTRWLMENSAYAIAGALVLLVLLIILFVLWRSATA